MFPKKIRWLLIALGSGAIVLSVSLSWIDRLAAQGSIGQQIKPSAVSIDPANLLINPDFENGYTRSIPCCNNIAVPIGWNIRWYTDTDPASGYTFFQPEVKLDDNTIWPFCDGCAPNVPPRIHTGRYAVDSFKGFASQDTSLYQQVGNVPIGAIVTGSAWLQAWVSSCNGFPKNFPPQDEISLQSPNSSDDGTCTDGFWPDWSNRMMVGIDPTGGIDPRASSVVWNIGDPNNVFTPRWHGPYDYYSSTLPVTVTAQAFTVTIFLRGITTSAAKFHDIYFDTAKLTYSFPLSMTYQQGLPWPLASTITVSVQSIAPLAQVSLGVVDSGGLARPLTFIGTSGVTPSFASRWTFNSATAGTHAFTLTEGKLPTLLSQTIDVPILPYSYVQDQLPPPTNITFTLYSPISLTAITKVLTDPLGSTTAINFVGSTYISPAYTFQWTFAPIMTGAYTLDLFATQFVQHWQIPIVAASDRVFLPMILQNFIGP